MKATKEELEEDLAMHLFYKRILDDKLINLENKNRYLAEEFKRINSLIGKIKNRLKKYDS